MSNLEVTPSPTPCSKFCSMREFFDCAVCGWNEEAHYLEARVWYRSMKEVDMDASK